MVLGVGGDLLGEGLGGYGKVYDLARRSMAWRIRDHMDGLFRSEAALVGGEKGVGAMHV